MTVKDCAKCKNKGWVPGEGDKWNYCTCMHGSAMLTRHKKLTTPQIDDHSETLKSKHAGDLGSVKLFCPHCNLEIKLSLHSNGSDDTSL